MHATLLCSFLVILSCLTAADISCSNSSYYVVATGGDPCPNSSSTCQELSYYTNQTTLFGSNTVFYFLKGRHILNQAGFVTITGVTNLIWQGMGAMEMGPHETTMQSTVVIKCNRSTGGFKFTKSKFVTILNISLTECAAPISYHHPRPYFRAVGLYLINMWDTYLQHISIHNVSGIGLRALNCFNLTIEDSSFFHNQFPVDNLANHPVVGESSFGANVVVVISSKLSSHSNSFNKLSIVRSNFSFSLGKQFTLGSGLTICLHEHKHDVLIDSVVAYNNSGAGNINMICNTTQYAIIINNTRSLYGTSILPNAFNTGGAGFYLRHEYSNATEAKLFVYNSDFSHNCAVFGAGMSIRWFASSAGEVVVDNCTFYNNTGNFSSALYVAVSVAAKISSGIVNPMMRFVNNDFHGNQPFERCNSSVQSTITVQNVADIVFDSINVFNNLIMGLIAYSSTMVFEGNNIFLNNSGVDGGGMALYGSSYIVLSGPALVNLTANNASHNGGGLYISQPFEPVDTLCFFQKN